MSASDAEIIQRTRDIERLADREFQEWVIDKVRPYEDGAFAIEQRGTAFLVPPGSPIVPEVGMTARLYGKGFGYPVYGLELSEPSCVPVCVFYKCRAERELEHEEFRRAYDAEHTAHMAEPMLPEEQVPGFEWQEGTRQISGFGGGYERACRKMVSEGCKWWSEHPDAHPEFKGFKGIYGVINEENEDAKALTKAILSGSGGDATGAMHQASVNHVFAWKRLGSWQAYQDEMKRLEREDADGD